MDKADKLKRLKEIYDNSDLSVHGVSLEEFEKIFLNLENSFLKIAENINNILNSMRPIEESFNFDEYNRFAKYQKRVKNRKILYAKRKHKYGK